MKTSAVSAVTLAALASLACRPGRDAIVEDAGTSSRATGTVAGKYTAANFAHLRWIEGRWRGFMPDGKTFYEQYRFVDDSTIAMHSFPDSTFTKASDSSRVLLRDSTVANEGLTARWVATRLDTTGVDFAPHHGAQNHFTWARETPTQWNATLRWSDKEGRPRSVVYALHRFGR